MKPRYLEPDSRSRDRWMVSYVDVLTILLIFFISVAMKTQKAPAQPLSVAPPRAPVSIPPVAETAAPVAETAAPPRRPLADLQKRLEEAGLDVHLEARGVVVSLPQTILFVSGDDQVSLAAVPIVEKIATTIHDIPNRILLVGYADNVPISNRRFRSNWELAAARGLRLLELLTQQYGIPESRLAVASEGTNRPRSSNETASGRAINRRVEIVIADETDET